MYIALTYPIFIFFYRAKLCNKPSGITVYQRATAQTDDYYTVR